MCLLLNWQIVHCKFICISFSFVHALVCANCNYSCNCIFIQKKQKKKKRPVLQYGLKIPKLCHNTPLSIFSLGKGRESLCLKTLHKKLITSALSDLPPAQNALAKCQRCTSKLPKICIFFHEFGTFQ